LKKEAKTFSPWAWCLPLVLSGTAAVAQTHDHTAMQMPPPPPCEDAALTCAITATPAFDRAGMLHLAWAAGGRVVEAKSSDKGVHFGPPRFVNAGNEHLDNGPDSRPSIVVDPQGRVTVAYAIFRDKAWNGEVEFSRAEPGDAFVAPTAITADSPSQRFQALAIDPQGQVFAAWLDKRNTLTTTGAKKPDYAGAALAWAWAGQDGKSFGAAQIAVDNTCECCRLGIAFAGPGRPVVMFRNVFPGSVRDHAVVAFRDPATPGPVHRVSDDDWVTTGCPHHGPSLAIGPDGTWHAAWFTAGNKRKGVFYARSQDEGGHFSDPLQIGEPSHQAGRPSLLVLPGRVLLAWKEFNGDLSTVKVIESHNAGASFEPPRILAETADASDHPLLVGDAGHAYLSWLTHREGYRLIEIGPGQS
jgi:hypothetical protein